MFYYCHGFFSFTCGSTYPNFLWGRYEIVQTQKAYPPPTPHPHPHPKNKNKIKNRYKNELIKKNNSRC